MEIPSKSDFKKLILKNNKKILEEFERVFEKEIKVFVGEIFGAYKLYKKIDEQYGNSDQGMYIAAYLFNAINNLASSFNLLISGYLIPAGNLMRHFTESSAMAILSSNKDYLERVKKEGNKFPVQKSLDYVAKHKKKFNIDSKGWTSFNNLMKKYHLYSHASLFSIATSFVHSRYGEGYVNIGSFFDSGKLDVYRIEIRRRIDAVKSLKNITEGLSQNKT